MSSTTTNPPLVWLESGQAFPSVKIAWGGNSAAPGLLCAGADLTVQTLVSAYGQGIFPWFSQGQPILWWSPDPRMVLSVNDFCMHHSLRKTLQRFAANTKCEIRLDSAFEEVLRHCAQSSRVGQGGTWIVPEMINAYKRLHHAGFAHSVETWVAGELVGGLYFVSIGKTVFGESMFYRKTDASKIALAALVCLCRHNSIEQIDCQQNTPHLASLGAREIARQKFVDSLKTDSHQSTTNWYFSNDLWSRLNLFKANADCWQSNHSLDLQADANFHQVK